MNKAGSWEPDQKRWRKALKNSPLKRDCFNCKDHLPSDKCNKKDSEPHAVRYFQKLQDEYNNKLKTESTHPELTIVAQQVEQEKAKGKDTTELDEHIEQVKRRPSGATRELTDLERERKKALEELLEVKLDHVPLGILTHLLIERPILEQARGQGRQKPDNYKTLGHLVDVFVSEAMKTEQKGVAKTNTTESIRYSLKRFSEYAGRNFEITNLSFSWWKDWSETQQGLAKQSKKNSTARRTYFDSKRFCKWLLKTDRIEQLPKNFDDYKLPNTTTEPAIFEDDELKLIFDNCDDEMELLVLLALNTGANQIDIAELNYAKNPKDLGLWQNQIRRKRVKTGHHETVPKVRYELWPRTIELLNKFKQKGDIVLLNSDGGKWVSRTRGKDNKLKNNDAVGVRFKRLMKKLKIKGKSFKTLRATAASKLGNNKDYRVYAPLFLGHAPDSVFEANYLKEDCKELNAGIAWLEEELFCSAFAFGTKGFDRS
jgi:integrase